MSETVEANFDGIVGPTHNYSGLAFGNLAATDHAERVSHPKQAALQGLAKMKALHDMGLVQGVLPPQERPDVGTLRRLGFSGSDHEVIAAAHRTDPGLLQAVSSASAMWAANAATISPSADTADGKVHITPANLSGQLHRSIEADTTARILRATFMDRTRFVHHEPIPSVDGWGDEGAANHSRFAASHGQAGTELFVFGRPDAVGSGPRRFPARQSLRASRAVARLHRLDPSRTVFAQQNPEAVDRGVFHNDVIAVGHLNVLFCHEEAFADSSDTLTRLRDAAPGLEVVEVPGQAVTIEDAVRSYLFNSQLVSVDGRMLLIAPSEVRAVGAVSDYLDQLVAAASPIDEVITFDLRQSMQNGGGPACLRLRVVLSEDERAGVNPATILDDSLYERLVGWVELHYRDTLTVAELASPLLLDESRSALDHLTQILGVGSIYAFQR